MSEVTTIQLHKDTRNLLRSIGRKGETYDELIKRLIKAAKKNAFFNDMDRILETEEFTSLDDL